MSRRNKRSPSQRRVRQRTADFRGFTPGHVQHFYDPAFDLGRAEFEDAEEDGSMLTKQALVMIEGTHVDSAKRKHQFPADRIKRIVANTNALLASGGRVPWQRDHQKTQAANIGDLDGPLEIRTITRKDLPHKGLNHLIGKIGAFATRLVAKGADVVREVLAGNIKTLSPGIDVDADIIREISATPVPAIVGLSTFRRGDGETRVLRRRRREEGQFTALTFEDMEVEMQDMEAYREDFDALSTTFWELVSSINKATEDELQGEDPAALQMQAIDDYGVRIQTLLGLNVEPGDPEADPLLQQNQKPPAKRAAYSAFSLGAVEREVRMAEFRRTRRDRGRKRGKRVRRAIVGRTPLGQAARLTAVGAVGVGAIALANRRRGAKAGVGQVFTPNQTSPGETFSPKARTNPAAPKPRSAGWKDLRTVMNDLRTGPDLRRSRSRSGIRKANPYRRGSTGRERAGTDGSMRGLQRYMSDIRQGYNSIDNALRAEDGLNRLTTRQVKGLLPSKRGTVGPNSGYRRKRRAR